jgi:hypothetical protein
MSKSPRYPVMLTLAALLVLPAVARADSGIQVEYDDFMEVLFLAVVALPVALIVSAFAASRVKGRMAALLIGLLGTSLGAGALFVGVGFFRDANFWTRFGLPVVLVAMGYFALPGAVVGLIACMRKTPATQPPKPEQVSETVP